LEKRRPGVHRKDHAPGECGPLRGTGVAKEVEISSKSRGIADDYRPTVGVEKKTSAKRVRRTESREEGTAFAEIIKNREGGILPWKKKGDVPPEKTDRPKKKKRHRCNERMEKRGKVAFTQRTKIKAGSGEKKWPYFIQNKKKAGEKAKAHFFVGVKNMKGERGARRYNQKKNLVFGAVNKADRIVTEASLGEKPHKSKVVGGKGF